MRVGGPCVCGLLALAMLSGCTSVRRDDTDKSAVELLSMAEQDQREKRYEDARKSLQRLITRFPDSEYVAVARLRLWRVYSLDEKFEEARAEYLDFIKLYPQHDSVDEAYYFLGMAYNAEMKAADRDQTNTRKALEAFDAVAVRMPDSPYAADARLRVREC